MSPTADQRVKLSKRAQSTWSSGVQRFVAVATCVIYVTACSTTPASLPIIDPAHAKGESHQVLVVTSRAPDEDALQRYAEGNLGSISYPSSRPNADREFALTRFADIDAEAFTDLLNQRLQTLETKKTVFIFVHGYNVPYSNGVYRTGQLVADFEANAVPVHYSWPSQGRTLG